jgi:7,8-dihydropterin-6-yl-methyl-4-(beta-D-ribofuranosyl)aminobenzene 5'-phosphate synthase
MKLTVLVDNNTLIDKYFLGEPGVSYLIEDEGKQILFDVGYSDAFLINAHKLGIDILKTDFVIISHGHYDHTWGLDSLLKLYTEGYLNNLNTDKTPKIIIHELTFNPRPRDWLGGSNPLINPERLKQYFQIEKIKDPFWLTKNLVCLPNIPRLNNFESKNPYKKIMIANNVQDDFVNDEISLAYKTKKGLVIVTGCGHAGICNTIEYAKKVCDDERIVDVIGGFHLQNPPKEQMDGTLNFFKHLKSTTTHPCHCVDLKSKIELSSVTKIEEIGVGLTLQF